MEESQYQLERKRLIYVSTLPSSFGERVVLRILEKDKTHINLNDLGFSTDTLESFKKGFSKTEGIILVTGQQDQEKQHLYMLV